MPKGQPKPKIVISRERPEPPQDLDGIGLEAWQTVCNDLQAQGTLCYTDRGMIEVYARSYSFLKRIENQLEKEPLKNKNTDGRSFINPLVNAYNNALMRVEKALCNLKLSPSTRAKNTTVQSADMKKWSELIG